MKIFIDGLQLLRVESDIYIDTAHLANNEVKWLKNEGINQFFTTTQPIELHHADQITINHINYPLEIGVVTLTKEFDQKYRYDGQLGYVYHSNQTSFALFTPVAKEVFVIINDEEYPMTYEEPIWRATISGNHEGKTYAYKVRLVNQFKIVSDPYAYAAGLNKNYIIDWNKTEQIIPTPIKLKRYVDAVIYEGHVRDMSINLDVESKGLFEGLIEPSKKLKGNVLSYIKKLGMTHLQLLPIYDFEDVYDDQKNKKYNWGYNPSQYFAIEGWYSKNPSDPYNRINELKKVINTAHQMKLGINMDVVYNHVYQFKTFPYDHLVPGYFYRHDQHHKMTDASFCGNDVETRNYMVRKLIVDSLIHWTKNFQMDGFRFDLMGLLDLDTMYAIETALRGINPYIMLYGEGWNMQTEVPAKLRSNMANHASFTQYAHFNDFYRNVLKGELHGPEFGYSMGNKQLINKAMYAIIGSPHQFKYPSQSINYVECHDNLTFYDKMLLHIGHPMPEFKTHQDLANHLVVISQGVPFFHAGQEFYRTKKCVENSYDSPDIINQIEWNIHEPAVAKLKKLLKIRKKYRLYRQDRYNESVKIERQDQLVVYCLENDKYKLTHYIKINAGIEKLPLEHGRLIFPSQDALTENQAIYVDLPGVYIIYQDK